jgi:hypothetical protein
VSKFRVYWSPSSYELDAPQTHSNLHCDLILSVSSLLWLRTYRAGKGHIMTRMTKSQEVYNSSSSIAEGIKLLNETLNEFTTNTDREFLSRLCQFVSATTMEWRMSLWRHSWFNYSTSNVISNILIVREKGVQEFGSVTETMFAVLTSVTRLDTIIIQACGIDVTVYYGFIQSKWTLSSELFLVNSF